MHIRYGDIWQNIFYESKMQILLITTKKFWIRTVSGAHTHTHTHSYIMKSHPVYYNDIEMKNVWNETARKLWKYIQFSNSNCHKCALCCDYVNSHYVNSHSYMNTYFDKALIATHTQFYPACLVLRRLDGNIANWFFDTASHMLNVFIVTRKVLIMTYPNCKII